VITFSHFATFYLLNVYTTHLFQTLRFQQFHVFVFVPFTQVGIRDCIYNGLLLQIEVTTI